ncbi:MAG TPA: sulfur oxidation c-type cytochrome SoxX [Hyphomicrobiaceae bacterium]|jgi:sulfur-oxidizing protein SoxX|nr:sulfur oxidation c-type cytochrome SoxX [Hyphomicrobiaceae bacterium]
MRRLLVGVGIAGVAIGGALAQNRHDLDRAVLDKAIKDSWQQAAPDWQQRLVQDATQAACSLYRNNPPPAVAATITAREKASIKYPVDGKMLGDWKKGEKLAQSGYGMRFTDYPPRAENGGNCFACHQLDPKELSYGTLGPSLTAYGKNRDFAPAEVKAVYERIYNPQAVVACANMPRMGASGFLSLEQIADLTAYVMSPESPVNK